MGSLWPRRAGRPEPKPAPRPRKPRQDAARGLATRRGHASHPDPRSFPRSAIRQRFTADGKIKGGVCGGIAGNRGTSGNPSLSTEAARGPDGKRLAQGHKRRRRRSENVTQKWDSQPHPPPRLVFDHAVGDVRPFIFNVIIWKLDLNLPSYDFIFLFVQSAVALCL